MEPRHEGVAGMTTQTLQQYCGIGHSGHMNFRNATKMKTEATVLFVMCSNWFLKDKLQ